MSPTAAGRGREGQTTPWPTAAMVEAAARAAAEARRGVTARVNDTDRAAARASLLAALPLITTEAALDEIPDDHVVLRPGTGYTCPVEVAKQRNLIARGPLVLLWRPEGDQQ